MRQKISYQNITWIDINKPNENDLDFLKKEFDLPTKLRKDYLVPIHRPKVETFKNHIFIVIHFPVFHPKTRQTKAVELDIILTPNAVITSHPDKIDSLDILFNDCSVQDYLKKLYFKNTPYLFLNILDFLLDNCLPMLDHISEHIDKIEDQVFKGKQKEMLAEIAIVKRDIIDIRRCIKPQKTILKQIAKKMTYFYKRILKLPDSKVYKANIEALNREVIGSHMRLWHLLENHKEMIESIEETNNSLLTNKTNEIVKILTIISFITFPLSVIAGIFGMNVFENHSFAQNPSTFWIIMLVMMLSALIMFAYFRKKKWL